jgi:superfamily II DNA or RNA helicase
MKKPFVVYAPGARIVVRDAEWLIRRVDPTSSGGRALTVTGISELVKDKEAIFLTDLEKKIEVLDPVDTKLVPDTSSSFQASLLYMESLLRQKPPTDESLYVGHQAAMDTVPYQLDPAIQSLEQPRQRILIADAVGLGKTMEAGVLMSELIRRGRGKRILVVAVKSMLTQFQKEMWCRFTIPLTRLDSIGLQRIRSQIPTNQNPFYYYDKAIISIDTLKNDREYSVYLENAYWDIIVIDEAQNVANRGQKSSMRNKLARLLASRSDTLIMLSATPHDGKARSFASLMNMLDPTAIANPDDYGPEDIKGLYIRRFKKDIQNQVESAFKQREIKVAHCEASPDEESAFDFFVDMSFARLDKQRGAGLLFKIVLEKALFSSPAACLETIHNRIRRMESTEDPVYKDDIHLLKSLESEVKGIPKSSFTKYQKLLWLIQDKKKGMDWKANNSKDRLVIFTERIETLHFLEKSLKEDLKLKDKQVRILHGGMSDIDQQQIVEDFGREQDPVRVLIASDVASEGINLHYLSHRMIHFDIPWSLMVFQQRNGRIDRYGQENTPEIFYLVTKSENSKIRGDTRILELLIEKDEQAVLNIGDPAAFMGVYNIDEEERKTANAIEKGQSPEEFEAAVKQSSFDPLAAIMGTDTPPTGEKAVDKRKSMPSLFQNEYDYVDAAINYLRTSNKIQVDLYPNDQRLDLTPPEDLLYRLRFLPKEIFPNDQAIVLSTDKEKIQAEIARARKEESTWPGVQFLWPLSPVVEWLNDKLTAAFGRHEAPIIIIPDDLVEGEVVIIMSGLIPNRKSHPMVHRWFGVSFLEGEFYEISSFESVLERTKLGRKSIPNPAEKIDEKPFKALLPEAIKQAGLWMHDQRQSFEDKINEKLNIQIKALDRLRDKQYVYLDSKYQSSRISESRLKEQKDSEKRSIDKIFDEYYKWVEDTMTTEDQPYLQIVAVFIGKTKS